MKLATLFVELATLFVEIATLFVEIATLFVLVSHNPSLTITSEICTDLSLH